ncbi:YqhR family membrane protein [Ammoniphilus sp. 3BR4]|uniref:YqhR family membrane protein n=1 Tax=Ammoniphilus sp. 3BR4 TaxID=3158265 RepID=UPI00346501E4
MEEAKNESRKDSKARKIRSSLIVGGVGGAFWAMLHYVAYYMNFTKIGPSIYVAPFFQSDAVNRPLAQLAGVGVATVLSMGIALAYVFSLAEFYSPWIGIGLGIGMFGIFYYGVSPLLALTKKPIHVLGMNTFATELSLYILWGLFVGFSLSTEFSSKKEADR